MAEREGSIRSNTSSVPRNEDPAPAPPNSDLVPPPPPPPPPVPVQLGSAGPSGPRGRSRSTSLAPPIPAGFEGHPTESTQLGAYLSQRLEQQKNEIDQQQQAHKELKNTTQQLRSELMPSREPQTLSQPQAAPVETLSVAPMETSSATTVAAIKERIIQDTSSSPPAPSEPAPSSACQQQAPQGWSRAEATQYGGQRPGSLYEASGSAGYPQRYNDQGYADLMLGGRQQSYFTPHPLQHHQEQKYRMRADFAAQSDDRYDMLHPDATRDLQHLRDGSQEYQERVIASMGMPAPSAQANVYERPGYGVASAGFYRGQDALYPGYGMTYAGMGSYAAGAALVAGGAAPVPAPYTPQYGGFSTPLGQPPDYEANYRTQAAPTQQPSR